MANRIKIRKLNRRVHYLASLLLFMLIFTYAFTGFIMSRYEWFPHGEPEITFSSHALPNKADTTDLDQLQSRIKNAYQIRGRFSYNFNWEKKLEFHFNRPGNNTQVIFNPGLDSIQIKSEQRQTFGEIATRIHRIHGFEGGILYFIWAVMVDMSGLASLVFAITGLVIWFRISKRFWPGWIILSATLLIVLYVFFFLRY
ncbi:MAG: PepSY-associated TM helix domain-containing protein [Candidatus Cyclobacteriaceae bacterium M3_2C_046]